MVAMLALPCSVADYYYYYKLGTTEKVGYYYYYSYYAIAYGENATS